MTHLHTKSLYYAGASFLAVISILAVIASVSLLGDQSQERNTISVTGEAEVSSAPDIATFSFTVSEVADTPEEAQNVISDKTKNILDGLSFLEIQEKDITTNSYTINPQYEWVEVQRKVQTAPDGTIYYPGNNRNQVLIGYNVRQNVEITLRNIEQSGDILSLLAQEAVQNVYGPNFEIEDPDQLQEEARLEAIADAKEKAQRLADNLDVKLGDVVSFNENAGGNYYPTPSRLEYMAMDMEEMSTPELPAGENDIRSRVTITYEIK